MLTITYAPGEAAFAARLRQDLQAAGYETADEVRPGTHNVLIVVLSPEANASAAVESAIIAALDNNQHVLPVLAQAADLPKLIDHLLPLDFSQHYDPAALVENVQALLSPEAKPPLRVRTPAVRRSNRRIGLVLAAAALIWFVIGLIAVGVFGIQAPPEEYARVETEIVLTRNYYLELNRPRTTQDAQNFISTLDAAPPEQLPYLVATATAQAQTP